MAFEDMSFMIRPAHTPPSEPPTARPKRLHADVLGAAQAAIPIIATAAVIASKRSGAVRALNAAVRRKVVSPAVRAVKNLGKRVTPRMTPNPVKYPLIAEAAARSAPAVTVAAQVRLEAFEALKRSPTGELPKEFRHRAGKFGHPYELILMARQIKEVNAEFQAFRVDALKVDIDAFRAGRADFRKTMKKMPSGMEMLLAGLTVALAIYKALNPEETPATLDTAAKFINEKIAAAKAQGEALKLDFNAKLEAENNLLKDELADLDRNIALLPPEERAELLALKNDILQEIERERVASAKEMLAIFEEYFSLAELPTAPEGRADAERALAAGTTALAGIVVGLSTGNAALILNFSKYLQTALKISPQVVQHVLVGGIQIGAEQALRAATTKDITPEDLQKFCAPIFKKLKIDPKKLPPLEGIEARVSESLQGFAAGLMGKVGASVAEHLVGPVATPAIAALAVGGFELGVASTAESASDHLVAKPMNERQVEHFVKQALNPVDRKLSKFKKEHIDGLDQKAQDRLRNLQEVNARVRAKIDGIAKDKLSPQAAVASGEASEKATHVAEGILHTGSPPPAAAT